MEKRAAEKHPTDDRRRKVTKRYPVLPPSTSSLDNIVFKQNSTELYNHYQSEVSVKPGCFLAFSCKYPYSAVFIHELKGSSSRAAGTLTPVIHRNIVQLAHTYVGNESIYLIYEMTIASLKDILSFRPCWGEPETIAVCRGVLLALKYMHETLHISHGNLRPDTIRLDLTGSVKISNIGESQLLAEHDYGRDIRCLGDIVPRLGGFKEDSAWLDFLQKLRSGQAASSLLKHTVLGRAGIEDLQHCVLRWLATRVFY